jgi:hypothetical protein
MSVLLFMFVHFLPRGRKRNQKKTPVPRLTLRSPMRPEHAETHPPNGGLRQSAHFNPSAPSMLGAGQRVIVAEL